MRALSGHTTPFAVFGHPIGHTLSPVMHNASFDALRIDAIYLAFDVHPDRLMDVLPIMRDLGFKGVNLTVPLKEVAFRGLADLADSARLLGAVNTVEFTPTGLLGHNTDGYGFLKAMEEAFGPSLNDESVFVLGTGGAGRAVALVSGEQGASRITLTDIDPERVSRVADEIKDRFPACEVVACPPDEANAAALDSDVIIQSTPVGMKADDPVLLGDSAFKPSQKVFDLIYMFPETPLLRVAREKGAAVANGLGMLLHQGARAFTIWTSQEPSVEAMRKALEEAVYPK